VAILGRIVGVVPRGDAVTRYDKTADGVRIAYQVFGDGPIDVLNAGGLWWNLEFQWTDRWMLRYFDRLARLGRVIQFDLA